MKIAWKDFFPFPPCLKHGGARFETVLAGKCHERSGKFGFDVEAAGVDDAEGHMAHQVPRDIALPEIFQNGFGGNVEGTPPRVHFSIVLLCQTRFG